MEYKRDYPEELTAKMHDEFTIDEETEICHKVGTITEFYHTEE